MAGHCTEDPLAEGRNCGVVVALETPVCVHRTPSGYGACIFEGVILGILVLETDVPYFRVSGPIIRNYRQDFLPRNRRPVRSRPSATLF